MELRYSTQRLSQPLFKSYGSTPFTYYSWHLHLPQQCLEGQRLPHRCEILSPFNINPIPLIVTALWYQPGGTVGGRYLSYEKVLMQNLGVRPGNAILKKQRARGPDKLEQRNCSLSLCQTKEKE